jgi:hypothetical protein
MFDILIQIRVKVPILSAMAPEPSIAYRDPQPPGTDTDTGETSNSAALRGVSILLNFELQKVLSA